MSGIKSTVKHNSDKANGGNGYYLPTGTTWTSSPSIPKVMNIDVLSDDTKFTTLKGLNADGTEIDLLQDYATNGGMNLATKLLPATLTNLTWRDGFTEIAADRDIWLNLENDM